MRRQRRSLSCVSLEYLPCDHVNMFNTCIHVLHAPVSYLHGRLERCGAMPRRLLAEPLERGRARHGSQRWLRLCFAMVLYGVVWCGVVWCYVVWCGVVWCGVLWCVVVWCGVGWVRVARCAAVCCGVLCFAAALLLFYIRCCDSASACSRSRDVHVHMHVDVPVPVHVLRLTSHASSSWASNTDEWTTGL